MNAVDTLVVAGCSHSFGAETVSEFNSIHPDCIYNAYGKFLSEKLNCKYVNLAQSGISNFEISRNIQQYIMNNKIDFSKCLVIIGWTDPNRFTFYPTMIFNILETILKEKAFPYNFSSYSINFAKVYANVKGHLNAITSMKNGNEFLSFFDKHIFKTNYFYDLNYLQRLYTSTFLSSLNVKFLTFSTLIEPPYTNTFKYEKLLATKNNLLEYKDKFNFYDRFKQYGIYRGGHLKIPAHKACSDYLYNVLVTRNIL